MVFRATSQYDAERRRTVHHEADVVVVGAGIFGCAMAYALANQGRSVILLERWMNEPDRIVGELLQPGGLNALRKLGLGNCVEGIDAIPCHGYHVMYHNHDVIIPYPVVDANGIVQVENSQSNGYTNGDVKGDNKPKKSHRQEGVSFHHGRFIMQLRNACAAHPNITILCGMPRAFITRARSFSLCRIQFSQI